MDVALEPASRSSDGARGVRRFGPPAPRLSQTWTRVQPTRPAARCARPRAVTTRSLRWCTQRPSLAIVRPRRGTDLRPADVLTSALGNPYTALGISICSPHAQQAGSDCTQTRHEAKLAHCGPHLSSLFRQNISCTSILWSACWRPHRDTLRCPSRSIALKRNFVFLLTLEIWKRSARQIRACWPLAAILACLDN